MTTGEHTLISARNPSVGESEGERGGGREREGEGKGERERASFSEQAISNVQVDHCRASRAQLKKISGLSAEGQFII